MGYMRRNVMIGLWLSLWSVSGHANQILSCDFPHVGTKEFVRDKVTGDFTSAKEGRWQTLETGQFLQLRSPDIDEDYVTNPFTVYLYGKESQRIRQISAAMRAAPMMADGRCELTLD